MHSDWAKKHTQRMRGAYTSKGLSREIRRDFIK
jgi:hypothetical protein